MENGFDIDRRAVDNDNPLLDHHHHKVSMIRRQRNSNFNGEVERDRVVDNNSIGGNKCKESL